MYNATCLTVCYCVIYRTIGLLKSSNTCIPMACLLKLQMLNYMHAHYRIYYLETLLLVQNYIVLMKVKCQLKKEVTPIQKQSFRVYGIVNKLFLLSN